MSEKLKWAAVGTSVLFFILFIIMTILYVNKEGGTSDKITKLDLPFSTGNNTNLKENASIEAFLLEKGSDAYLVIPGDKTQNKLIWNKITNNSSNPTEVKSDTIDKLKGYKMTNLLTEIPGYFNNCGNYQTAKWTLNNGTLSCGPFRFNANYTDRDSLPIDLKNCPGNPISGGFGATVIKLQKI